MKRSILFKFFLYGLIFFAVERFCHSQTKGFRLHKVTTCTFYPYYKDEEIPPEIIKTLSQSYSFLGSGVQCFAFLSEDGKTVLKLFKHKKGKMQHRFESAHIASEKLTKETGVTYCHLGKAREPYPPLVIHDPLGIAHLLDMGRTEFIIQKKAVVAKDRFSMLLKKNKLEEALSSMNSLLQLIYDRSLKGIKKKDGKLLENCGFIGDQPVEIDVGSYVMRSDSINPNPHKKAASKAKGELLRFVKSEYPEHVHFFETHLTYEKTP